MYVLNRKRRRNLKRKQQHPLLADLVESQKRILEKRIPKSAFRARFASYGGKKHGKTKPRESKADL